MERGRVIDAVAHESDDVASTLQREDDPVLLRWRDPREHRRLLRQMTEGRVVDPGDVVAGDDLLLVERDGSADVTRDTFVVAGQNLHRDAVALELRQHVSDVRQDGVGEADEARQHEIGLIVARVGGARLQPAVGDRQDAQTILAHVLVDAQRTPACVAASSGVTWPPASNAVDRSMIDSGRTFGDEQPATAAIWRLDDDGEAAPLEVERDLVDLLIAGDVGRRPAEEWRHREDSGCRSRRLLLMDASVNGRGDDAPIGSTARSNCITPLVSVPVLSLHRMSMLPKS